MLQLIVSDTSNIPPVDDMCTSLSRGACLSLVSFIWSGILGRIPTMVFEDEGGIPDRSAYNHYVGSMALGLTRHNEQQLTRALVQSPCRGIVLMV